MSDFSLKSWVEVSPNSDFSLQNLPFGIFSTSKKSPRVGVAIGDRIIDLVELNKNKFIQINENLVDNEYLNDFMAEGREFASKIRLRIMDLLREGNTELKDAVSRGNIIVNRAETTMHMPVRVGDYTDFYSSEDHARNVGTMFRDPDNALLPNWKHLPVGYHGRASSIVVSPAAIHRPKGQTKADDAEMPSFGPTRLFDFELEMAFITCKKTKLGESISVNDAENAIWGMVIFNDLSARDIQKWEYVPLGPFLAKNFGSVISPWVVTMDALEPFRTSGYKQDPEVLPYLKASKDANFDIHLEVALQPDGGEVETICTSNYKFMYWNMNQQLAHQTVNGCNINVGDMYASGTISGPEQNQYGSMLELTWRGTKPIMLKDGSERKFLQDGDTCIMRGYAQKDGVRVGFGEALVKILPAN
ncbi:MAG: fumarylacetoacetase [Chitinophagales bacterium]|nr:fumarylacetoacetase [Chitinophagales bacterium]